MTYHEFSERHQDLESQLRTLNESIREQYKLCAELKDDLATIEASLVMEQGGGWAALGKNDTERKYAVELLKRDSDVYQKVLNQSHTAEAMLSGDKDMREQITRGMNSTNALMDLLAAELLAQAGSVRTTLAVADRLNGQSVEDLNL